MGRRSCRTALCGTPAGGWRTRTRVASWSCSRTSACAAGPTCALATLSWSFIWRGGGRGTRQECTWSAILSAGHDTVITLLHRRTSHGSASAPAVAPNPARPLPGQAEPEICSRQACNGWPLRKNGDGKSFAQTAHLMWLPVHLHGVAEGTGWVQVSAHRCLQPH